ncbi:hypothetical protein L5F68_01890 [Aliarcobacter butzleri]|uniref:hypothetical protein n=1 Tax=Aliarcobacter butzleri TaxID=28197 RepID=UPI001EDF8CAC|nr:hypothetical protein [Aliarcobacter butzleri]MCG3703078.1 hypothetical protein [Aliarcobacter butzleri]MDN5128805.1 hypothetical protein [Aliarcobacter butzleri]
MDIFEEKHFIKLKENDESRVEYTNMILEYLDKEKIAEYDGTMNYTFKENILDKNLFNYAELQMIEACLSSLSQWVNNIKPKDQKNDYLKKNNFVKKRDDLIAILKKQMLTNQQSEALELIKTIEYNPYDIFTNYEDVMTTKKEDLYIQLVYETRTPKTRAKKIVKILDYFNYKFEKIY